jgi:hypothetical protein
LRQWRVLPLRKSRFSRLSELAELDLLQDEVCGLALEVFIVAEKMIELSQLRRFDAVVEIPQHQVAGSILRFGGR